GEAAQYIFKESDNLPQYLFISVIVALFLGLTVSAEEIIRDQKILNREKFLNLSKRSYLISKIGIMFLISAIQALMYVLVGNAVLDIKGMWVDYWLILFSTSCFANLLGLNISASFNSAKVIYILIPILIIPQLLFSGVIVKFDKLHPFFSSQASVPWIGNVMASRWAYEALAVNQFKNNEFEQQLFEYDKKLRYYNWKKDFWVKNLRGKVVESKRLLSTKDDPETLDYNLTVLRNEFEKEVKSAKGLEFELISKLNPTTVDSTLLNEVDETLDQLFDYYKTNYNLVWKKKDQKKTELSNTPEKRARYLALEEAYSNESLRDFVTNSNELEKIVEYDAELVQKNFPIYLTPEHKGFFGAQFYAPTKNFFGKQITTKSANLLVIWGMTFLLTAMLFVDGLRWFIERISGLLERFAQVLKIKVKFSFK
ncbi:MAG: ABC transporter permease, partial [Flavobacteriales bacterium]|nr:ABC transporter permease [Flavobacteriales bacterium]